MLNPSKLLAALGPAGKKKNVEKFINYILPIVAGYDLEAELLRRIENGWPTQQGFHCYYHAKALVDDPEVVSMAYKYDSVLPCGTPLRVVVSDEALELLSKILGPNFQVVKSAKPFHMGEQESENVVIELITLTAVFTATPVHHSSLWVTTTWPDADKVRVVEGKVVWTPTAAQLAEAPGYEAYKEEVRQYVVGIARAQALSHGVSAERAEELATMYHPPPLVSHASTVRRSCKKHYHDERPCALCAPEPLCPTCGSSALDCGCECEYPDGDSSSSSSESEDECEDEACPCKCKNEDLDHCEHCMGNEGFCGCWEGCPRKSTTLCVERDCECEREEDCECESETEEETEDEGKDEKVDASGQKWYRVPATGMWWMCPEEEEGEVVETPSPCTYCGKTGCSGIRWGTAGCTTQTFGMCPDCCNPSGSSACCRTKLVDYEEE